MSKGLGKTQQKVLSVLRKYPSKWFEVTELAIRCYHPERVDQEYDELIDYIDGKYVRDECSRSARSAIHRSIDKLQAAGLVETKIVTTNLYRGWWKKVKFKC